MTIGEVRKACKQNKYIIIRFENGMRTAINCGVADIIKRKHKRKDAMETNIISFIPCDFNEYISEKSPFM